MTGIQYITGEKSRQPPALIDPRMHAALWEDIQDIRVSRSRRPERRIPLAKVKAELTAIGKLVG